jgi:hypothetical protein
MENLNNPRKEKEKGSGFTNIQKVIDANKGNRLGSAVSSNLTEMGQKTQQAVNNAVDRFGQQMEQGALGEKQKQERENVLNKVEQGQAIDDKDIQSFSRFRQGQYTGPRGIENKEQLLEQADRGQAIAGSVGTQQGRQGLLQQFSSSPKYTRGTLRTDAMLLGQEAPKLQEAATGLRGVSRNVQTAARSAEEQAKQAELKTQEFGRETEKILEDRYNQTINPAQQAQKEALDKYTQQQAKFGELQNVLAAGDKDAIDRYSQEINLDPNLREELKQRYDNLRRFGLSEEQAGRALFESMKLNQQDLGKLQQLGTFMDQGTVNKIAALQRLSGKEVQDFGEIGGYKEGYTTANTSALQGLEDLRHDAFGKQSYADRVQHAYTHNEDGQRNALAGTWRDRNFYIERDPELDRLYREYDKLIEERKKFYGRFDSQGMVKQYDAKLDKVESQIYRRTDRIVNSLPAEIQQLRAAANRQSQITTLKEYLDYMNSGEYFKRRER